MRRKDVITIVTVLAAFILTPLAPAQASQLVDQTWLTGTEIRSKYGQFVDEVPRPPRADGANELTVSANEFQQKMLPSTFTYPAPFSGTYLWGFGVEEKGPASHRSLPPSYPGPTVVVHRYPKGDPRSITRIYYDNRLAPKEGQNHLVLQEYLTVDQTLHWADPLDDSSMEHCGDLPCTPPVNPDSPCCKPYLGPVPVTVHLHGAETPSAFDGHPDSWWTPNRQQTGPSFVDNRYTYLNTMQPTALWYHDHALGITRINIYSGLAAFYFIRGNGDTGVPRTGLKLPAGERELELVIADRMFDSNGQLIFPDGSPLQNAQLPFGPNGPPPNPTQHPFWIPEFFGDVIVVNGKVWPRMTVEPARYRFRILNGSNARFYNLKLSLAGQKGGHGKGKDSRMRAPQFWVIGTDGGPLDRPVPVSELLVAPSERYDVIIDFGRYPGYSFEVTNDANAPFPDGDPVDPDTTGKVMRFDIGHRPVLDASFDPADPKARLRGEQRRFGECREDKESDRHKAKPGSTSAPAPPALERGAQPRHGCDPELPPIVRLVDGKGGLAPEVVPLKKRQLVLVESEGANGPNEVLLNNTKWNGRKFGTDGLVPGGKEVGTVNITELPVVGSTELWEIVNLTDDAHPIHVHLGQFQLMNRQDVDIAGYVAKYDAAFGPGGFAAGSGPPNDYAIPNGDGALGGNPALGPYLDGAALPPKPVEFGWKDVCTMLPAQVTRIVVRIAPQDPPVGAVAPGQNLFAFDPTATLGTTDSFGYPGGPGYIWHCHILDHEDNEMMRPYIPVNPGDSQGRDTARPPAKQVVSESQK